MSDVRKIIDLDRLSRFKDDMDQEIAGQTPAISGNKLTIGSSPTPIAQDIVNVNDINGVPTTAYGSADAARAAVDASSGLRIQGQIITYLLADGWYTDQYIGSATDSTSWGTASNWKTLGPVSVSQNTNRGGYKLSVGSETLEMDNALFADYVYPSQVQQGKRIKADLTWEVASDSYKYVEVYLKAGKYRVICGASGGNRPSLVKFTDGTYTTASLAIINAGTTESIITLEAGYYVLCWNSEQIAMPSIILYDIVDNNLIENSNNLALSGAVKAQIDRIDGQLAKLPLSDNAVVNLLFKEIVLPSYDEDSTYEIFVNVAYLVSGNYYNSLYLYKNGGTAITIFDENYPTQAEALAAFGGFKYRYNGQGYAVTFQPTESLRISKTSIVFKRSLLLEYNPCILSFLNQYKLTKKTILWEGDSICADNEWNNTGWRTRVQSMTGALGVNASVGGSVITDNLYNAQSVLRPCVYRRLSDDMANNPSVQYFIFDGGTNDADVIGRVVQWKDNTHTSIEPVSTFPTAFGSWNETDFGGTYDTDTFCGAFEQIIYNLLTTFKDKKIGYIIAPKMGDMASLTFYNRKAYFDTAKAICKKWGVPVLDLWENTWMNPALSSQWDGTTNKQANVDAGNYYLDGQHPTPKAYDYLSPIIAKWIESL